MQPLKVNIYVNNGSNPQVVKNKICSMVKLKITWDILKNCSFNFYFNKNTQSIYRYDSILRSGGNIFYNSMLRQIPIHLIDL